MEQELLRLVHAQPVLASVAFLFSVGAISYVLITPFVLTYKAYRHKLRSQNIASRGWPPPHLDADGKVITVEADGEEQGHD